MRIFGLLLVFIGAENRSPSQGPRQKGPSAEIAEPQIKRDGADGRKERVYISREAATKINLNDRCK
jgi:hypothetical protein